MVPSSYHPFFSGALTATGALIGLLFVAISIVPHKLSGEQASTGFQIKAGMAFSMLINALVLSLYALLPGENLPIAGLVLAIVGISSITGLAVLALRDRELRPRAVSIGVRFLGIASIFTLQLIGSLELGSRPHDTGPVSLDCTLVVVCLLVAIDRAWELLGATDANAAKMLGQALLRRRQKPSAPGDTIQGVEASNVDSPGPDIGAHD